MPDFLATLWTVAQQAPLTVGFSRQEYWNEFPFSSPGDFSTAEMNLSLLHWQADSLQLSLQGSPHILNNPSRSLHVHYMQIRLTTWLCYMAI